MLRLAAKCVPIPPLKVTSVAIAVRAAETEFLPIGLRGCLGDWRLHFTIKKVTP